MKEPILRGQVEDQASPERGGWIPSTPGEKALGPVRIAALNLMSLHTLRVYRRIETGK
jgi:hypothetical protein